MGPFSPCRRGGNPGGCCIPPLCYLLEDLWPRSCYAWGGAMPSSPFALLPHPPGVGGVAEWSRGWPGHDQASCPEREAGPVNTGLSWGHKVQAGGWGPSCYLYNKDSGIKLTLASWVRGQSVGKPISRLQGVKEDKNQCLEQGSSHLFCLGPE